MGAWEVRAEERSACLKPKIPITHLGKEEQALGPQYSLGAGPPSLDVERMGWGLQERTQCYSLVIHWEGLSRKLTEVSADTQVGLQRPKLSWGWLLRAGVHRLGEVKDVTAKARLAVKRFSISLSPVSH